MQTLKIRGIDNRLGVTLPKEVLQKLNVIKLARLLRTLDIKGKRDACFTDILITDILIRRYVIRTGETPVLLSLRAGETPCPKLTVHCSTEGDTCLITETENGVQLTAYDPDFEAAMQAFAETRKNYRNALRELAK